ncbi:hypothetical protein R3P38DRAFT_3303351 [Favolaschia claudopus]|uniref:Uncharacterized protein n=1 Tax=Favolaschia claudopus TaxID=2862362 RepID=A0AAW0E1V1_9AGAR
MSSASIFAALAVLENARVIEKTKTVVFDGQIYLGSSIGAAIGSLRYFNSDNQDFADVVRHGVAHSTDVGCYCVVIQSARTTSVFEVYSQELAPLDYHFFGDILSIIPLGSPGSLNIRTHATVHVCGVPSDSDKPNSTFDIKAEQYLSATKTPDNAFPVHCVFPATPRWEKYKPIPGKGKSVSHFIVDIEKVTFLGNASSTAPKAEEINTGTPARLKFTGFFGDQAPSSTNTSASLTNKRMSLKTRVKERPLVVAVAAARINTK